MEYAPWRDATTDCPAGYKYVIANTGDGVVWCQAMVQMCSTLVC